MSFFFGRRVGGVGIKDPDPEFSSSCFCVNSDRRSASDCDIVSVNGGDVAVFSDDLDFDFILVRLLVGLPDPLDPLPEGVGENVNIWSPFSGAGPEIERISSERPLGVGANSNAEGFGSTFFCSSSTSFGISFNAFSFGKCGNGASSGFPLGEIKICASPFTTTSNVSCRNTSTSLLHTMFTFLKFKEILRQCSVHQNATIMINY